MDKFNPNFCKGTVSGAYDAAAVTILLNSGDGARFLDPAVDGPFNFIWWNARDHADPSDDPNREICRCTARAGDVMTIVRAQEGTSATAKNTPGKIYKIHAGPTRGLLETIRLSLPTSFAGDPNGNVDGNVDRTCYDTVEGRYYRKTTAAGTLTGWV